MALRLTKRVIDGLLPRDKVYVAYDAELKGFGLRILPTGSKTWIVEYRPGAGGRAVAKRRIAIGSAGTLTPDQARSRAKTLLAEVRLGVDPAARRNAERQALNMSELCDAFVREHVLPKRKAGTAEHYQGILRRMIVAELGSRKAETITTADLSKVQRKFRHIPIQANRMLAVVSSLYGWASRHGHVPKGMNPVTGLERYREQGRERYLTGEELARLGETIRLAETIGLPWQVDETKPTAKHAPKPQNRRTTIDIHAAAAIRLLLLTGCRLREILHLRWDEIDWDRGLLLLPDSKVGRRYVVLNAPALALLEELPRIGVFVIASASAGTLDEKPRPDLKKAWTSVSKHAELTGVRLHDLRHTHASIGAGAGLGLPIIGKLLGHSQASTTQRYAHFDNDPLRRASDQIGNHIAAALDAQPKEVAPASQRGRGTNNRNS